MPMQQAFSYNFATVENPLSDSGNFVTINDGVFPGGTLKTVSGNLCEATAASTWGAHYTMALSLPPVACCPTTSTPKSR